MTSSALPAVVGSGIPPQRGPIRALNAVGRGLARLGVPLADLSADVLCLAAQRRTGLTDFGDDAFRQPLDVLTRALDREARLHPVGRLNTRIYLLNLLTNRLMLQDWWTRHPEILRGSVRAPIFVLGLPRTGTTLMQKLLASDPASRWLSFWEAHVPCPPPSRETCDTDARRRVSARYLRALDYLSPGFRQIHELEADGPEECYPLLSNSIAGVLHSWFYDVPSYDAWLADWNMASAYEYYRRQLLLLQWHWPGERWVLKSPVHLFALDALLAVFPDARIVQLHRDPGRVVASWCSLIATIRALTCDRIDARVLARTLMDGLLGGLDDCRRARRQLDPAQVCDVRYHDLVRDPLATMGAVYARFGIPFGAEVEAGMRRCLADSPQHKHGVHRYSLEQWGLAADEVRRRFASYCEVFAIPREE